LLTHRASDADVEAEETETESETEITRRRVRRWFRLILGAIVAIAILLGLWFGYAWTQTRYYVGASGDRVAIYNGISQTLGPISLSKVASTTDITMSSLPDFQQQKLRAGIPANSLSEAQEIVASIRTNPQTCLNAPSSAPTPGASASPSAVPSASAVPPPSPVPPPASPSPAPSSPRPSGSPSPTNPCLGGQ
uniref:BofC C-terminal domain-containing protein n=1 Tax=Sinomonas sp. G460-2 TaxID=3393464 RepID=UPI0039F085A8